MLLGSNLVLWNSRAKERLVPSSGTIVIVDSSLNDLRVQEVHS